MSFVISFLVMSLFALANGNPGGSTSDSDDSPDGGLNEGPLDPHLDPRMLFQFSRIKRNAHFLR